jgi:hypothetical protein
MQDGFTVVDMYVVSAQNNVSTAKKGTREIEIRHKINSYSEHSTKIQIKQNNEQRQETASVVKWLACSS